MIKLLALDMDGTLLDQDKKLLPETLVDLDKARAAGVLPVICTGRPLSGVLPYLKELGWQGKEGYVRISSARLGMLGLSCSQVRWISGHLSS